MHTTRVVPANQVIVDELVDGVRVLRPLGEWDLANAPDLDRELALGLGSSPGVVIDLSEVDFLDSSVINVLVRTSKVAQEEQKRLVLVVHPSCRAWRPLEVTGVLRHLESVEAVDDAVWALQASDVGLTPPAMKAELRSPE